VYQFNSTSGSGSGSRNSDGKVRISAAAEIHATEVHFASMPRNCSQYM